MRIIDDLTYEISAAYTEPSISQDGQPLTDLAYTELEYRIGASPVEVLEPRQLATSPNGGGQIASKFTVPAPTGVVTTLTFNVFAVDLAGNRSPLSADVVVVIDRVGPAAPTGFTIA